MIKHQGGCHCGQIKFTTEYDPLLISQCNCVRCRRLSGAMTFYTVFAAEEINLTGNLEEYDFKGGSGLPMKLFFCGKCSTKIYYEADAFEGFKLVIVGSFDDSLEFEPQVEVFTNYKMKWLRDNDCIKERFSEAAVYDRLTILMENIEKRNA